ncbi:glutamine amidotransferase [Actinoplanes octamycinicus]|uniref:Gamma-glutamyl-hercynylcysteine sulfoxide hydrolase n=1 Tax=Actinoplanes octamycinicus TaxID=135948 RepID=A0A7W7H7P8_9ACTN|nr:ergothioneine biosynthesis protein EgtC [Actinoplanes octamycinicus]MBB4745418.1 glutamine amidotransferase [Actinoplanes octamycinicus]GIE56261.1 gamma-glutamyl-hercynylcysteine sulfoxide hydrolase [Actinoplanes octamycinicus]
MCRHLAYLGPPVPLSALLLDPPHALAHQAWAPRDMRGGGTINADGFGVGWFPLGADEPIRYRSAMPIWSDAALPALAAATTSGAVLAAVRSATVGMPVVETAAAPFLDDRWLISHNGVVRGFPGSFAGLASEVPVEELLTLEAPTDSAAVSVYIGHWLRAGKPADEVLTTLLTEVRKAAPGSRLNLLLTDGDRILATTAGHALSVRATGDAVLVASEPLDDHPAWRPVPDNHLLIATPTDVTLGEV